MSSSELLLSQSVGVARYEYAVGLARDKNPLVGAVEMSQVK